MRKFVACVLFSLSLVTVGCKSDSPKNTGDGGIDAGTDGGDHTPHTLAVSVSGAGAGTVTSDPSGVIGCARSEGTCSATFAGGATVTLTATPDTGYIFGGWSGACVGALVCSVSMTVDTAVHAVFVPTLFYSTRQLSDSDPSPNPSYNIWTGKLDGTGLFAVTRGSSVQVQTPSFSVDGEQIVFVANGDPTVPTLDTPGDAMNIWLVNADGGALTPVTQFVSGSIDEARWTFDGRIVSTEYRSLDGGDDSSAGPNFWITNADGTGRRLLTEINGPTLNTLSFALSPEELFYSSTRGLTEDTKDNAGAANLFRVSLDGGLSTPLTSYSESSSVQATEPSLSFDGTRILYRSNAALDGGDSAAAIFNLWVVNLADGTRAPITTTVNVDYYRSTWMPDSINVVFESDGAPDGGDATVLGSNLFLINTQTKDVKELAPDLTVNGSSFPLPTPNGTRIVFDSSRPLPDGGDVGARNIWSMAADGSDIVPVTTDTNGNSYMPLDID